MLSDPQRAAIRDDVLKLIHVHTVNKLAAGALNACKWSLRTRALFSYTWTLNPVKHAQVI